MVFFKGITKFKKIQPIVIFRYFHKNTALLKALQNSPNAQLNKSVYDRYMCLPIPECKIQTTYIWIDGTGENLRSKSRTLDFVPNSFRELPNWGFNGSNTLQGTVSNSDCYLIPIAMYNDPIRRGNNKLVLCETFEADEKPSKTNHRQKCVQTLNKVCDQDVEFGFEQEYILTGIDGRPFGWPQNGVPTPSKSHYAGVGAFKVHGREIAECFYRCCLYCGLDIHGDKPEVVIGQWEFKIGPAKNIKSADDLWMARWLLMRLAEDFGVGVSLKPKFSPYFSGSGLHVTFSSKRMREDGGLNQIQAAIKKLEKRHNDHIKVYDPKGGADNQNRLIGKFQTSDVKNFSWGVSDRGVSVRIAKLVFDKKKGYFEDRRPAANADPYQILNALVQTCVLE